MLATSKASSGVCRKSLLSQEKKRLSWNPPVADAAVVVIAVGSPLQRPYNLQLNIAIHCQVLAADSSSASAAKVSTRGSTETHLIFQRANDIHNVRLGLKSGIKEVRIGSRSSLHSVRELLYGVWVQAGIYQDGGVYCHRLAVAEVRYSDGLEFLIRDL
jgi:hypothetical protein